jgi:hypothetical protein
MEIPTQFSYETNSSNDENDIRNINNNTYKYRYLDYQQQEKNNLFCIEEEQFKGARKKRHENIFDEVEKIKQKNQINEINYVDSLIISYQEYQRSSKDMIFISDMLNEEHILEMISTKKLFFVYKHILEIFAYLIGEGYFEWSHFRSKLNINELRFRMINCNIDKFSREKINNFLNRIYKNKRLSDEFLKNNTSGIGIIFKWIKATLKVCLYKLQVKKQEEENLTIRNITNNTNNNSNSNNSNINTIRKNNMSISRSKNIGNSNENTNNNSKNIFMRNTVALHHPMNDFILTNYIEPKEDLQHDYKENKENEIKNKMMINNIKDNINNNKGSGFYLTSLAYNNNINNDIYLTQNPNYISISNPNRNSDSIIKNSKDNNNNNKRKLPNIINLENIKIINDQSTHKTNETDSTKKEGEYENENSPNTISTIKRTIPLIKKNVHNKDILSDFMKNIDEKGSAPYNKDKFKSNKNNIKNYNYNILSLPLLKFKTYHQLKKFFNNGNSQKKINNLNSSLNSGLVFGSGSLLNSNSGISLGNSISEKFSLRNPKNSEKVLNLISLGKMKGINDETFDIFFENMKMEDYFKEQEEINKRII